MNVHQPFGFMSHSQKGLQSESFRLTLHMAQQVLSYRHKGATAIVLIVDAELSAQHSTGCHLRGFTSLSCPFNDLS